MRFCQDHWDKLRAAIDARGLSALVPDSGERAVANLADQAETGPTVDNFDPLMGAHNAILANTLDAVGLGLFAPRPDGGEWCPLCLLNSRSVQEWEAAQRNGGICPCGCGQPAPEKTPTYDEWIERAADDQVAAWKALRP